MKMFIRDKVNQKTGLNFDEYIDKPGYVLDMLHKEIQDDIKRNKNVVDELNNQFSSLS